MKWELREVFGEKRGSWGKIERRGQPEEDKRLREKETWATESKGQFELGH